MYDFSENSLVEQPAIRLLARLGWETVDCFHEPMELGREHRGEVVLTRRLRAAIQRLNPNLTNDAIDLAIEEVTRDRGAMDRVRANREVYGLLKEGVKVITGSDEDGESVETVRVIDWDTPANNDFMLASQLWVAGEMYTRRADLVGFVNGLPLLFIELKASHQNIRNAFDNNLRDYKDTIPQLFWYNAAIILSNGSESKIGSITSRWEHFHDWKKINSEGEEGVISLETILRGVCEPAKLLDIVENFSIFQESTGGLVKMLGRNHQVLGVNNAIAAMERAGDDAGKLGVFWHTQGSGKSVSMIFFAQKILRKIPGNWTFVIVTDRTELDGQIYGNFVSSGVITRDEVQADSSLHLRELLGANHRYIFTLIQKFRTPHGEQHPLISDRSDIVVITDEAHRSQYDTFALNMRRALPNARFIGFTGTPLMAGEELTRQVFGDYVSVYNFRQSIEDGATVPLYYENRIPELQLTNPSLNADMERLLEEAELDEDQERKVASVFGREYHLITRDERLETVAADIVSHFLGRGQQGKAMVVCIDKATAVRMYDKVRDHWLRRRGELQRQMNANPDPDIQRTLDYMDETDMAVIVSQSQNEIADMAEKGLDFERHRRRMVNENMEEKFKDPDDPFRIVFVCAMWMTGFDVPSCSTIYLDKPMRNHTLMQTIARANRVFRDKHNGLIVDYVGVFRNLEQALAIYGSGAGGGVVEGDSPVKDKSALVDDLELALAAAESFLQERGIPIQPLLEAREFDYIGLRDDAINELLVNDDTRRHYESLARDVARVFRAILPDQAASEYSQRRHVIVNIADAIQSKTGPADISGVMSEVEALLDRSIAAEGYVIRETSPEFDTDNYVDLGKVDFEALRARFEAGRKRIEAEKLRGAINGSLRRMVRLNSTRMDYLERFQQLIDEYNSGSLNVQEYFDRLGHLLEDLSEEQQRHVAEDLSEEELALFDLLTKPDVTLTRSEELAVKKAARDLLAKLDTSLLSLDWKKRQQSRAAVRRTIETVLDDELPDVYTPDVFDNKCQSIYDHIYERYAGAGISAYTAAA